MSTLATPAAEPRQRVVSARKRALVDERLARVHRSAQWLVVVVVAVTALAIVTGVLASTRIPYLWAAASGALATALVVWLTSRDAAEGWVRCASACVPVVLAALVSPGAVPLALALLVVSLQRDPIALSVAAMAALVALGLDPSATRADGIGIVVEVVILSAGAFAVVNDVRMASALDAEREIARAEEARRQSAELEAELASLVAVGERREMERSIEARGRFLAAMGHELRTPLNAVVGYLDLLSVSALGPSQVAHVEGARVASRHVLELVDDVLDHAKIESGNLRLDSVPFSLREIVATAVTLVSKAASDKKLALSVRVTEDAPDWVVGDPLRVRQIVLNLLSNAVKFTFSGGVRVRIERRSDGAALVSVSDDGPGIGVELQQRIFEPYRQADESTAREHGGTGLGLAISRELARAMGGDLAVESVKGHGATFRFHAPLAAAPERPANEPPRMRARPRNLSVLLADDNAVNRLVAKQLLEVLGHRVELAENGEQAVALATSRKHDVVIMDVEMPAMDGLEATRRLRAAQYSVPILGFTAHAGSESNERCMKAGMTSVMHKPIDLDRLNAALARVVPATRGPASGEMELVAVPKAGARTSVRPGDLDVAALRERVGGDEILLESVLDAMTGELPTLISAVRQAARQPEPARLAKALHGLKGCAANAASTGLVQEIAALERDVLTNGAPAERIERTLSRLEAVVRALQARSMPRAASA